MTKTLLLLPGDGIGPEVTEQSRRIAQAIADSGAIALTIDSGDFGGMAFDRHGAPLPDDVLARALAADAVLMGAVGGPQWKDCSYDVRPEAGLLRLRAEMNAYANLRPAYCFAPLASASTLKSEHVAGLDMLFVRELTGGVYFGAPRGIETLDNGERRGINTHVYTSAEIRRVAEIAFQIARTRRNQVCSVEKGNVMEAGLLWREEVAALHAEKYADVELSHMLADNCAMQLVKNPRQFDVILTDNLFGDILSDTAAMLTGSIGMLPSAAIGDPGAPGLYEPIHGSAPDIAGRGVANPCASILSLAMAFRHSLGVPEIADRIDAAVASALDAGVRTPDLGGTANAAGMGDAVLAALALPVGDPVGA
ncbi:MULTISPECIES: 3-isopropylmalate dehydrogenase [unclassified Sphingomonas]|uniref:3-isopropylmalate dehydrogenase n=1 Tax=unclassified Sphingomonas TaxID=196159 RepID=UPI00070207EB|nr:MULTISPECIES: 3-isopropylmalate dehydrogenase [unclassified Sphingomonas]KQX23460.1 3-isopropylmalate dehydrogenase [Sphingomonas sp. Root1294]KQY68311.1 3-isopropylmalate dehydrogenase [Sphingomonas sp. Root50]KRB91210.1 3-isopropylmalate dehydrogenase [Sphingomonas sp. Root720]